MYEMFHLIILYQCLFYVFVECNVNYPEEIYTDLRATYQYHRLFSQCFLWCNASDVKYFLYTRKNPEVYQELKTNDTDLLINSNFDFNQKTKIIVHGWLSEGTGAAPEEIKNAYLQVTDDNIINVDWSRRANTLYSLARQYVPVISESLKEFLIFLVANGVKTSDLHLVGHSLGAHVVGVAGYYYQQQMNPIKIISGLDPAKPLFEWSGEEDRLDKNDAIHVEVIHSCGGFLGLPEPVGHLDFYPNAGRKPQPGCGWDFSGSCSHHRSVLFFAESITSRVPFTAVKCSNYDEVYYQHKCERYNAKQLNMSGFNINFKEQGVYYLKTKAESPFALGDPSNWDSKSIRNEDFDDPFWFIP